MVEAEIHELRQRFGGGAPTVQRDHCLNQKHRHAGCTRCQALCPTQAIKLTDGLPILNEEACVHCGGCVGVCPTDSFGPDQRAERLLLRTAASLPQTPMALVCAMHPHPQTTSLPVAHILRHGRCLAALSAIHLLALSLDGNRPLWLEDSPCAACPLGSVRGQIEHTVAQANQLLALAGLLPSIRLASDTPEAPRPPATARPLAEGQQPQISRRGLFSGLGKALRGQSANSASTAQPEAELWDDRPSNLPISRLNLLAWLTLHPAPASPEGGESVATADLPFAAVEVNGAACSGCGLCARLCPTDALVFVGDTLRLTQPSAPFALNFRPAWCIDCAICGVICPEKAISFGHEIPAQMLSPESSVQLASGDLVPCSDCQAPTAQTPTEQPPRCHVCRSLAGPRWSEDPFA